MAGPHRADHRAPGRMLWMDAICSGSGSGAWTFMNPLVLVSFDAGVRWGLPTHCWALRQQARFHFVRMETVRVCHLPRWGVACVCLSLHLGGGVCVLIRG